MHDLFSFLTTNMEYIYLLLLLGTMIGLPALMPHIQAMYKAKQERLIQQKQAELEISRNTLEIERLRHSLKTGYSIPRNEESTSYEEGLQQQRYN